MKIAICDDEDVCLAQALDAAKQYAAAHTGRNYTFETFSHPEDLLEAAEKIGGYDIYILDIIMPGMNGINLGAKLREAGYDGKIIYLTSSEDYYADAFRVRALEYLIKPVSTEPFARAIDDAAAQIKEKKDKFLLVKAKERSVKLTYDSIMYAVYAKRAVCFYLAGGRVVESLTLRTTFSEAVAELLADPRFTACGQSMVVNLDHVTEVERDAVVFGSTYRPFLGEKLCRKLRGVWSTYLFEEDTL